MAKNGSLKSARNLTGELAARSRARRRVLKGAVAVETVSTAPRRNDPLPELKLETRSLSSLKSAKRKLRDTDPAHVAEVAASISRLGVSKPIVITRDGEIIDGHIVVAAARTLGLTEISCVIASHLSDVEGRILRLALNRLGEKGTWNLDALQLEFTELIEIECPLDGAGFEFPEIDFVLVGDKSELDPTADIAPDLDHPPVTLLGDVWNLDGHRLLCGDACKGESYGRLFEGAPPARVIFTDPPFNCPIDGFVGGMGRIHHREFVAAAGELSPEEFEAFLSSFLMNASTRVVLGGLIYSFIDARELETLLRVGRKLGLTLLNVLVWNKGRGGMGGLYRNAHEFIVLFKCGKEPHLDRVKLGKLGRDRTTIWSYPGATTLGSSARAELHTHPTPKSVELLIDGLLDVTERGEIVLDPFAGSGTIFIAAEKIGRVAYGLELDPRYCDVIIRRFEKFTGRQAVHAASGLTFAKMAALRERGAAAGKVVDATWSGATDTVDSVAALPSAPRTTAESVEVPEAPTEVQAPMTVAGNS